MKFFSKALESNLGGKKTQHLQKRVRSKDRGLLQELLKSQPAGLSLVTLAIAASSYSMQVHFRDMLNKNLNSSGFHKQ